MHISIYVIMSLAVFTLTVPSLAAGELNTFKSHLIYGTQKGGSAPATWRFDPNSGHSLGGGIQLKCFRYNLKFYPNGKIEYPSDQPSPDECLDMRWSEEYDQDSGAVGLRIEKDNTSCRFESKIDYDKKILRLATSCNQKYSDQPLRFRYFLAAPQAD